MAELVERRARDPVEFMTRVRTPLGTQEKLVSFPESVRNVVLARCRCTQLRVCIRTHINDHVRTLMIL